MKKILLFTTIFYCFFSLRAEEFSNGQCALIVASRPSIEKVKEYIDSNISNKEYLTIYEAQNGWYAISIGMLKPSEVKPVMEKWKSSGKIPQDSFCATSERLTKEVQIATSPEKKTPQKKFSLKPKKTLVNDEVKTPKLSQPIIATGYGISKDKALNNAFRDAIKRHVGITIDAETQLSNDQLIKDEILTASNGYIRSYDVVSEKKEDGLFVIEIKAIVKSQMVAQKIQSLHIATKKLSVNKNKIAEVMTKKQTNTDLVKLVVNALSDFTNPETASELLNIEIIDATFSEEKEKDNKIPLKVKYSLTINENAYLSRLKHLEQIFENLGLKKYSKVDLPRLSKGSLLFSKHDIAQRFILADKSEYFFTVKQYGQKDKYRFDVWKLPKGTYEAMNKNSSQRGIPEFSFSTQKMFNFSLEVKNQSRVIFSESLKHDADFTLMQLTIHGLYFYWGGDTGLNGNPYFLGVTPLIKSHSKSQQKTFFIDVASAQEATDITIEIESKF